MARVKLCRLCGYHNGPGELFCASPDCGTSLADVSAVDSSEIERMAAEAAEAAAADGGGDEGGAAASGAVQTGGVEGPRPGVGGAETGGVEGPQPGVGTAGQTVRDVQAAPCALVFPWGRVPVAGQMGVGREAGFSPVSGQLDAYPTVSRQHAVISAPQGQWTVRDLGSTNGTYVNGARLAQGETRPIQNGDQVGFSRGLQVGVEIATTGGASGASGY